MTTNQAKTMKIDDQDLERSALRDDSQAPAPRPRATRELWSQIKADYLIGKGSMRALAADYNVSASTLMKKAVRERWAAQRELASSTADAALVTTLAQKAARFVDRSVEQTDRFLTRISESEALIGPEDRQGLRQLAATFKDVVAVGRDSLQLGDQDQGNNFIVNLGFLASYKPDARVPEDSATAPQRIAPISCRTSAE
jgi:hypothetical protein